MQLVVLSVVCWIATVLSSILPLQDAEPTDILPNSVGEDEGPYLLEEALPAAAFAEELDNEPQLLTDAEIPLPLTSTISETFPQSTEVPLQSTNVSMGEPGGPVSDDHVFYNDSFVEGNRLSVATGRGAESPVSKEAVFHDQEVAKALELFREEEKDFHSIAFAKDSDIQTPFLEGFGSPTVPPITNPTPIKLPSEKLSPTSNILPTPTHSPTVNLPTPGTTGNPTTTVGPPTASPPSTDIPNNGEPKGSATEEDEFHQIAFAEVLGNHPPHDEGEQEGYATVEEDDFHLIAFPEDNVYDQPFKEAYPPVTASTPGPPTNALPGTSPQPVTVITPIPGKMTQSSTTMAVSKAVDSVLQTSFPSKHESMNRPKQTVNTCCDRRKTTVNLRRGTLGVINNLSDSVEVLQEPTEWNSTAECSSTALVKVQFDKITSTYCPGLCIKRAFCGRLMMKVELELHENQRSGGNMRMFGFGDSKSNDGNGGDNGTQQYCAEVDGKDDSLMVYPNDVCQRNSSGPFIFPDALAPNATKITVSISNEFLRIQNDLGYDKEMCSDCLFAFNGHPDNATSGPNQDVYIALNRVVSGMVSRNGYGVCKATMSWLCPWPVDC